MNILEVKENIYSLLAKQQGRFAIAFKEVNGNEELLINENYNYHAASLSKIYILVCIYKNISNGIFNLDTLLPVTNCFRSKYDDSFFELDEKNDSEKKLYSKIGSSEKISVLTELMIAESSNLSTNILFEFVGEDLIKETLMEIGISETKIVRGVQDIKSYKNGINNLVTARDVLNTFAYISDINRLPQDSRKSILSVLEKQTKNSIIPAGLKLNAIIAHKTGSIRGVRHDAGIISLPNGIQYILVLLSDNLQIESAGVESLKYISMIIGQYITFKQNQIGI